MFSTLSRATTQRLQSPWILSQLRAPVHVTTAERISSHCFFSTASQESKDPSTILHRDPSLIKLEFKERLAKERELAQLGGGKKRIQRQHERGSLSARERLDLLFDVGTFQEIDQLKAHRCTEFGMADKQFPGDGIVTGHGLVNGRHVYAFSQGRSHKCMIIHASCRDVVNA